MNTNRTGFETTEDILHPQGCYGGQAEYAEIKINRRERKEHKEGEAETGF